MLEWLRNLLHHNSQVTSARVFYVIKGSLMTPFIFNNSVETAAPFNVVMQPPTILWAEKLISEKASTSCSDRLAYRAHKSDR